MIKTINQNISTSKAPAFTAWACGAALFFITLSFSTYTYYTSAIKDVFFVLFAGLVCAGAVRFRGARFVFFLPLILFVAYNMISFLFNPYKLNSLEDFILHTLTYALPLILAPMLNMNGVKIINKFFLITCTLCYLYGAVQAVDIWLWQGADIFPWARAFGARVFSTQANPNFFGNFLAFSLFGVLVNFVYFKEKKYAALFILGLIDLYFTESKGAWVAFGAGMFLWSVIYTNLFLKKYKFAFNIAAFLVLLAAIVLSIFFAGKRMQSVDFRLETWRGTLSMAGEKPVFGFGESAFKTYYPKYRRAQVFYIENIHNNETAHPENEYLEVLVNGGIAGLGLFLFFIIFIFFKAFKKLKILTSQAAVRAPPEAYVLLSSTVGLAVILIHNFFDVSLRFSSTAFFACLFISLILFLTQPVENNFEIKKNKFIFLLQIVIFVPFILLSYFYFKAGRDTTVAHYFMRNGNLQGAITYATKAIKNNPSNFAMRRFRAHALSQRYTRAKTYEPFAGDKYGEYKTDFDRAQQDYQAVARHSPYEALYNFDYGMLLYTRAQDVFNAAGYHAAAPVLDQSEAQFKAALTLDPVLVQTYLALARIEIFRDKPIAAREWLFKYIKGPPGVTEEKYLATHKQNPDVENAMRVVDRMIL